MHGNDRRSIEDRLHDQDVTLDKVLLTAERNEEMLREIVRWLRRTTGFTLGMPCPQPPKRNAAR